MLGFGEGLRGLGMPLQLEQHQAQVQQTGGIAGSGASGGRELGQGGVELALVQQQDAEIDPQRRLLRMRLDQTPHQQRRVVEAPHAGQGDDQQFGRLRIARFLFQDLTAQRFGLWKILLRKGGQGLLESESCHAGMLLLSVDRTQHSGRGKSRSRKTACPEIHRAGARPGGAVAQRLTVTEESNWRRASERSTAPVFCRSWLS